METVKERAMIILLCVLIFFFCGCEGCLRFEDMRMGGFLAQAVIHRQNGEERVSLRVAPEENGHRRVTVEWEAPEEMRGLRVSTEGEQIRVSWHGLETDGAALRHAVGQWEEWMAAGQWQALGRTDYRGREAICVSMSESKGWELYMDGEGKIPLGLMIDGVEWEFLSYERMK